MRYRMKAYGRRKRRLNKYQKAIYKNRKPENRKSIIHFYLSYKKVLDIYLLLNAVRFRFRFFKDYSAISDTSSLTVFMNKQWVYIELFNFRVIYDHIREHYH